MVASFGRISDSPGLSIDPLVALGVLLATGVTDAAYVLFAALGSWLGAYASVSWMVRTPQPAAPPH